MTAPLSEISAHTPGPWGFDLQDDGALWLYHRGETGEKVLLLDGVTKSNKAASWVYCNSKANAHLISAAPELLDALKMAIECIAYCRRAHKDAQSGDGFPVELLCQAAVNKAEGKP